MRTARLLTVLSLAVVALRCGTTAPSCTYAVTPAAAAFPPEGGSVTFSITTGDSCAWTVTATGSWFGVLFTSPTRSGSGTVQAVTGANTGSPRTGSLTIAGHTVSVTQGTQAAAPTYSLSGVVKEAWIDTGLPGATVSIAGGPSRGSTSTDERGAYTMSGLLPGVYSITFSRPPLYSTVTYPSVNVAGNTTFSSGLSLTGGFPVTVANLQGYWVAQGPYPNQPCWILLVQSGNALEGWYKDSRDYSTKMQGTYSGGAVAIDVGTSGLTIEGRVEDARCIRAFIKNEALGGNFPVSISRGGSCAG